MNEKEFAEYVHGYYGDYGIFNIHASMSEIMRAIEIRKIFNQIAFECDSIDREFVRDIILAMRG